MSTAIQPGLAVAIAGQVAVGLAAGDLQTERSRAALLAIGLMLLNASKGDELVSSVLDTADTTRITSTGDGSYRIETRRPA